MENSNSFWITYRIPLLASAGYLVLLFAWLVVYGLLQQSHLPGTITDTNSTMMLFPLSVFLAVLAAFMLTKNGNPEAAGKVVLLPLVFAVLSVVAVLGLALKT